MQTSSRDTKTLKLLLRLVIDVKTNMSGVIMLLQALQMLVAKCQRKAGYSLQVQNALSKDPEQPRMLDILLLKIFSPGED